jgi:tetratricopeptide (TPR) repeat protein
MAISQEEIEKLSIEKQLRCHKLKEEIHQLKKPLYEKPAFYGAIAPIIIGALAFAASTYTGLFDAVENKLEARKALLEKTKLVLEIETDELEKNKASLEKTKLVLKEETNELEAHKASLEKTKLVLKEETNELEAHKASLEKMKLALEEETNELEKDKALLIGEKNKLEEEYKEKQKKLDVKRIKFDKLQNEHLDILNNAKEGTTDTSKPISGETRKKLEQFEQKVAQEKSEDLFTFDDWLDKGLSKYKKGEYYDAITSWTKALEESPEDADTYSNRGNAYKQLKQYEKAIEDFSKLIELEPTSPYGYFTRGGAYKHLEQHEKAIEDFSKVIEVQPEFSEDQEDLNEALASLSVLLVTYIGRGDSYLQLKQYEKAIEDFSEALTFNQENALVYISRGNAYLKLKQYEKAIEDYDKFIELEPESTLTYLIVSQIKIIVGNYESALDSIEKLLLLPLETSTKKGSLYLECITKKLLNMDISLCEKEFNEILKKDSTSDWDFKLIESWLKDADINDETRAFIKEKSELLKIK